MYAGCSVLQLALETRFFDTPNLNLKRGMQKLTHVYNWYTTYLGSGGLQLSADTLTFRGPYDTSQMVPGASHCVVANHNA